MLFNMENYCRESLYLSDFQACIAALPQDQKQTLILYLTLDGQGKYRKVEAELPASALLAQQPGLFQRYVLAMMNNLLVSFGGVLLELYFNTKDSVLYDICQKAMEAFDVDASLNNRKGYGVYINYINRMNLRLDLGSFRMRCCDITDWQEPDALLLCKVYEPGNAQEERKLLRRAASELSGKCICSLDIGGNSIKGAVVKDGEIALLKEHQWYPAGCLDAEEMLNPIMLMLRFLSDCTVLRGETAVEDCLAYALQPGLSEEELSKTVYEMESRGAIRDQSCFDAIVIGFPDIVVKNKIAGGESFKHQGMKTNPLVDYEKEFAKTVSLDDRAREFVKPEGVVIVLNDGNAASFITSVELAFGEENWLDENGMFANTIGTEMGTGFVSPGGTIQHFPLEGFQHVIDLGNTDYASYPAQDVRSINSMNTGIAGTVQKYTTQLGLFRLAVNGIKEKDRPLFDRLVADGLLMVDEKGSLLIQIKPLDRRGEFTRMLFKLLAERHTAVQEAVFTMGKAMGVLIDQDRIIFPEITTTRLLSGGIVASDIVYEGICSGLKAHNPEYKLLRLDEELVSSPLLAKMRPEERNFNVAIGSAYIGNRFLIEQNEKAGEEK